jgi:type III pantothenate kinase
MAQLYIDRGNTALKWQLLDDEILVNHGVANKAEPVSSALDKVKNSSISKIIVSSVSSDDFEFSLNKWSEDNGYCQPVFVESSKESCGVINAYAEPNKLGVDRLLAMIAAHNTVAGMLCVVDSGTALTMDFLDKGGQHLGGFIVPGAALMETSLLSNADKIDVQEISETGQLGSNTTESVSFGITQMLQAFVLQKVSEMEVRHQQKITLIVTGGHATELTKEFPIPFQIETNLVFQGLKLWSDSEA